MARSFPTGNITSLAYYIRDELFESWKENRRAMQDKWQRNLDAFKSISSSYWKSGETEDWRSDTFKPVTKEKILAAWSIVIDIQMQGGKIPFMLVPSPWDDVIFDELPPEQRKQIEDSIEDMTALIHQQFEDCKADRQLMKCVMSRAIYGETYAKRYVQEVERYQYTQTGFDRWEPQRRLINAPAWEYCSIWEIYRDWELDDLQAGAGIIQRQMTCPYNLQQLAGKPYYLKNGIKEVIDNAIKPGEADTSTTDTDGLPPILRDVQHRHNTIEKLEFWGRVPRRIAEDFERDLQKTQSGLVAEWNEYEYDGDEVEIHAVVADEDVIRYARIPEGEKRPYYRSVWEINLDHADGTGVADNLEMIQKVINGMVRAFEDNKKLSANVMAAVKRQYLDPTWDGKFTPGKILEVLEECDDARQAFQPIIVPDAGDSLLNGINLMERYADEASQIPKILQGEVVERRRADTAWEMNQLQQNAGKYIGGVIRNDDEGLVEPIVNDVYHYNMRNPEVKRGKGNYIAKALGFTSYQTKVERQQKLLQFLNIMMNDQQGILLREVKTREMAEEIAKGFDLDPEQILKSIEEKQREAMEQAQSEGAQMQMAAMKAALDEQLAKIGKLVAEARKIYFDMGQERDEAELERYKTVKEIELKEEDQELRGFEVGAGLAKEAALIRANKGNGSKKVHQNQ